MTVDVQCQGLVVPVDILDPLVEGVDYPDGQDGSKDLGLHQGIIQLDIKNDRGRDVEVVLLGVTSGHNLAAGRVQESLKAVEMVLVDDAAVGLGCLRRGAVEFLDSELHLLDKFLFDPAFDDEVVGRDTGLSSVEELSKGQTACCDCNVHVLAHECRTVLLREKKKDKGLGIFLFMRFACIVPLCLLFLSRISLSLSYLFPPSSRVTGVNCLAAAAIMTFPMLPLPV